jgi:putative membrane protein
MLAFRVTPNRPWWSVYLRGMAMGAADVVPGVSGGTMALLLGIYERLVAALRAATSAGPWRALRADGLRGALLAADAPFLVPLVAGIGTSVILLARVVEGALETHRVLLYAAFTGLVAASALVVGRQASAGRLGVAVAAIAAVVTAVVLSAAPAETPRSPWFIVLSGAIGIAALVLPGISGASILVLLGQYETVLGAIGRGDVAVLAPFAAGALLGLATVARVLAVLLRRYRAMTLSALTGLMIGSLRRLWPWVTSGTTDGEHAGSAALGWPSGAVGPEGWLVAAAVALTAAALVLLLERVGRSRRDAGTPFSSTS